MTLLKRQTIVDLISKSIFKGILKERTMFLYDKKIVITRSYFPDEFAYTRNYIGLDNTEFANAFGNAFIIKNSISHFRSLIFYSGCFSFTVKTIRKWEKNFLFTIFADYQNYMLSNPSTLLSKILGCIKITSSEYGKYYVIIMNNIFAENRSIDYIYDLKGSTVSSRGAVNYSTDTLKDNDWYARENKLHLKEKKGLLEDQIEADAAFLERHMILDYSLLIGIRDITNKKCKDLFQTYKKTEEQFTSDNIYIQPLKFNDNVFTRSNGGYASDNINFNEVYYVGIIDFLTHWTLKKRIEGWSKFLCYCGKASCKHPTKYKARFMDMIRNNILD